MQHEAQDVNLLGEYSADFETQQVANGHGQLAFDQGELIEDQQVQDQAVGQGKESGTGVRRKMSERELLGYQNDYGGTFQSSAQMEYIVDSDEDDDRGNFVELGNRSPQENFPTAASDRDYYVSTGQPLLDTGIDIDGEPNMLSSDNPLSSPESSSQLISEDILGSPDPSAGGVQSMDYIDPENWAPHMDALRSRRSRSPERSLSPPGRDDVAPNSEFVSDIDRGYTDDSQEAASLTQSKSSKSESSPDERISDRDIKLIKKEAKHKMGHIPRPLGSPKVSRAKKPLELPPWNDNVVIPPPPRMKPTLIGKQSDQLPPSPVRPKTAPSSLQYRRQGLFPL